MTDDGHTSFSAGPSDGHVAVVGDVHGHLQLALCVMARWQQVLGIRFEAVLLCGDVGTFTEESQLDSATRGHAKANPCEIEFLRQWSTSPQAFWLDCIFKPVAEAGLGLTCPVLMVHGNHEGFTHLERLVPAVRPDEPVNPAQLPPVDTNGHIRLLPSGWRVRTESGLVVAGIGGIERSQRRADYHPMAYIDEEAVLYLLECGRVDILLTHQGPSGVQGDRGSALLQVLLDEGIARAWFHGHSIAAPQIQRAGRRQQTLVVPLGDIAFQVPQNDYRGRRLPSQPGTDGWAWLRSDGQEIHVQKETPPFLREFSRYHWLERDDLLVSPSLAHLASQ